MPRNAESLHTNCQQQLPHSVSSSPPTASVAAAALPTEDGDSIDDGSGGSGGNDGDSCSCAVRAGRQRSRHDDGPVLTPPVSRENILDSIVNHAMLETTPPDSDTESATDDDEGGYNSAIPPGSPLPPLNTHIFEPTGRGSSKPPPQQHQQQSQYHMGVPKAHIQQVENSGSPYQQQQRQQQPQFRRSITTDPFDQYLRLINLINEDEGSESDLAKRIKRWICSRHDHRILVTFAGYMMPINILLNIISVGNGWLVQNNDNDDHDRQDYITKQFGYTLCAVLSLVLITVSAVSFVLRCIEFNVRRTTIISVLANFGNTAIGLGSAIAFGLHEAPRYYGIAHLSAEYYSTYAGCGVSTFTAALLVIDALITPGFRFRGSGMSRKQRTLQFNIIIIIVWIALGGFAYTWLEGWDVIEAMFFCVVTAGTIGFGNNTPSTVQSKVFTLGYGSIGILFFGLLLLNIRNVVYQVVIKRYETRRRDFERKRLSWFKRARVEQLRQRLSARPQPFWKSWWADFLAKILRPPGESETMPSLADRFRQRAKKGRRQSDCCCADKRGVGQDNPHHAECSQGGWVGNNDAGGEDADEMAPLTSSLATRNGSNSHSRRSGQDCRVAGRDWARRSGDDSERAPLLLSQRDRAAQTAGAASGTSYTRDRYSGDGAQPQQRQATLHSPSDYHGQPADLVTTATDPQLPYSRHHHHLGHSHYKSWHEHDQDHKRARMSRKAKHCIFSLILNVTFWMICSWIYSRVESDQWNYFDAMWFCFVAFTTIGFGDYVPKTTIGLLLFIILALIAITLETYLVVSAVSYFDDLLHTSIYGPQVQKRIANRRKTIVTSELRRSVTGEGRNSSRLLLPLEFDGEADRDPSDSDCEDEGNTEEQAVRRRSSAGGENDEAELESFDDRYVSDRDIVQPWRFL